MPAEGMAPGARIDPAAGNPWSELASFTSTTIDARGNLLGLLNQPPPLALRTPSADAEVKGADARLIERNAQLIEQNLHLLSQVRELKEIVAARDDHIDQLQHALSAPDTESRILLRINEMSAQVHLPFQIAAAN